MMAIVAKNVMLNGGYVSDGHDLPIKSLIRVSEWLPEIGVGGVSAPNLAAGAPDRQIWLRKPPIIAFLPIIAMISALKSAFCASSRIKAMVCTSKAKSECW